MMCTYQGPGIFGAVLELILPFTRGCGLDGSRLEDIVWWGRSASEGTFRQVGHKLGGILAGVTTGWAVIWVGGGNMLRAGWGGFRWDDKS